MRNPPNETLTAEKRKAESPSLPREGPGVGAAEGRRNSESAEGSLRSPTHPRPLPSREGSHLPERTCILSRTTGSRDQLIRLALGPDGEVQPDVRAKAPGRGAWLGVDRSALEKAQANGKLKGALTRAFKAGDVRAPADLGERIERALRQNALDRLGLEARAGTLLTGAEKIEAAARKGEVELLIHAADAGEDGNRKLDQAWRIGRPEGAEPVQGLVFPLDRAILSLALGRQNVVHIALTDRAAAARVRHALQRWRSFIGSEAGLSAATAGSPDAAAVD